MLDESHVKSLKSITKRGMKGHSLYLFSPENKLRNMLQKLTMHPYFDNGILILIFFSTLLLITDDPYARKDNTYQQMNDLLDKVMTCFFLLECLLKIIVHGFACNGPDSYLKSNWNRVDFMIALVSSISFMQLNANYDIIKVFRFMRVLRPLRLINRFPFMRIAIESIFNSVPQYANLLLILVLVNFLFSILGTSFFKGTFNTCHMDHVGEGKAQSI